MSENMYMEARTLALTAAKILDSKKAESIEVLHVADLTSLAEYYVICDGSSSTQVRALADELETRLTSFGIEPHHVEGHRGNGWVLLDYDNVVVHVFHRESREFYKLERLWSDADRIDWEAEAADIEITKPAE